MTLYVIATQTDGVDSPAEIVDGADEAVTTTVARLADILGITGSDPEWDEIAGEQTRSLLASLHDALGRDESWSYGEDADPHGATVAWGIVVSPIPKSNA